MINWKGCRMMRFLLLLSAKEHPGKTEKNHEYQYSRFSGSDPNLRRPKYTASLRPPAHESVRALKSSDRAVTSV